MTGARRLVMSAQGQRLAWAVLLIVVVLGLYSSALGYGVIWDDPRYYAGLQTQQSLAEIFTSPQPPTYQFYRPLAVVYGRLFLDANGVVDAPLAHLFQILAHLVGSLCLAPVLGAFGLRPAHARLAALGFAALPLAYFGVAWQQNQQPHMLMWLLLALLAAARYARRRRKWLLIASLGSYAAALLFQEGAAPFAVFFLWLAWGGAPLRLDRRLLAGRWWPLLHLGLVAVYAVFWLSLPLQRGVTGQGFQPAVLVYFLQGMVYPVAAGLTSWLTDWSVPALGVLFASVWLLLSGLVWRLTSGRVVLLLWAWTAVGVGPLWAGLSWSYAELGPRLIYPAALGVAGMWGGVMAASLTGRPPQRLLGALAVGLVAWASVTHWQAAHRVFTVGTRHLAQAVEALSADPEQRLLFINFPDRIEVRPRMYPLGFYGVILAPPVQTLADFARALRGPSGADESLAAFLTGAADREAWPHRVDMRGVNTSPEALWERAPEFDQIYLSAYLRDGVVELQEAGAVRRGLSSATAEVRWDETVELLGAAAEVNGGWLRLQLRWRCRASLQFDDTVFVHLWQGETLVAAADGDSVGQLLPLRVWQAGYEIDDTRWVDLRPLDSGPYEIRIGLYNRTSGARYLAQPATGPATEVVVVGAFTKP